MKDEQRDQWKTPESSEWTHTHVQQKVQGNSMEKRKPLPTNESGNIGHPQGGGGSLPHTIHKLI